MVEKDLSIGQHNQFEKRGIRNAGWSALRNYLDNCLTQIKHAYRDTPTLEAMTMSARMWLLLAQPFGFLSIAEEKLETSLTKALKCTASPETQACPPFLLPYRYLIA